MEQLLDEDLLKYYIVNKYKESSVLVIYLNYDCSFEEVSEFLNKFNIKPNLFSGYIIIEGEPNELNILCNQNHNEMLYMTVWENGEVINENT